MIAASLLLLTLAPQAQAAKKVELAYQAHPGQTVDWEISSEGSGSMELEMAGRKEEVPISVRIVFGYSLTGLETSGPDLIQQEARLRVLELDLTTSQGPSSHMVMTAEHATVDGRTSPNPIRAVFDEPFATVAYGPRAVSVDSQSHPDLPDMAAGFDDIITLILPALPEGRVKPGHQWTGSRRMPLSIQLQAQLDEDVTYTLTEVKRGVATIAIQGKYTAGAGALATARNGMQLEVEQLRYDLTGEAHFDIEEGVLVDSSVSLRTRFQGHTPDGSLRMSMDMPTTYSMRQPTTD